MCGIRLPSERGPALFDGPGEIRALARGVDWARTSLGPVESWPRALRDAVRLCLESRFPMCVWAGKDLVLVYNDGYPPVLGPERHPWALGRPAREVWAEHWGRLEPELDSVLTEGLATRHDDERFLIRRHGRASEAFFTYSFTPIRDEEPGGNDEIVGVLNVFVETTERVRTLAFRVRLADALRPLVEPAEIQALTARELGQHLGADRVIFADVRHGPMTAVVQAEYAREGMPPGRGAYIFDDFGPAVARTLEAGRTLVHDDCEALPELSAAERAAFAAIGVRAYATVPLVKDGRLVAFLSVQQGEPRAWASTEIELIEDVAERLWAALARAQAQAALLESEERYRAAFESAELERSRLAAVLEALPAGVAIAGLDGKVSHMNAELVRIWGGAPPPQNVAEYGGWRGRWASSGAPLEADDWAMARAIRTGEVVPGDLVEIERFDGSGRATIINAAAPVRDGAGHIVGGVVAEVDITAQLRAEDAVREAKERLESADRRKNHFIAVLSHELRNPLTPIRNSLYVLGHAQSDSEQTRRAVAVIERQVDHLTRLVDELLEVTRLTGEKLQLHRTRFDLNELLLRTLEDHRSLFEKAQVELEHEVPAEPVFVCADSHRVAQIIGNLLLNAAHFTPPGGRARVALTCEKDPAQAVLRVTDSGVGMTSQVMERLFEPFMQADTSLDRSKGGLGLGLALVKGIVELHGGSVKAESCGPGQGTELTVRLPLDPSPPEPRVSASPAAAIAPRRVLIIEDYLDAAESLREALELDSHDVAIARDGPEGIEKALELRPDIVLCDIGLPGMSGYEVARALRADESLRDTALVALTGYAQPEDLRRAKEAGFDRHMAKPPTIAKLAELFAWLPERSPS